MTKPTGLAFFQRGLDDAQEFVSLIQDLERNSDFSHAVFTEAYTEAMTAVAAAAQATHRVQLMTGIANIYWRHPYTLAMAAANVSAVSNQRFTLGLGTGHQPVNVAGLNYNMSKPVQRMRDYVEVLRECFAIQTPDDFVDVATSTYRASQVRFGWPGGNVPLVIGALGDHMVRLAGEVADGVVLSLAARARIADVKTLLAEGAAKSGRNTTDCTISSFVNTVIRDSRDQARPLLRQTIEGYLRLPYYAKAFAPYGYSFEKGISDAQIDAVGIAGPREYALDWIAEYRELGIELPILSPCGVFTLPKPFDTDTQATYRLLADIAAEAAHQ
jgi:alkanesulfonate monooxygenase SsuD/methylene tetrahydromethanopterin reductase-like flavin-dependent oxidoreductase (luciferase family)